MTSQHTHGTPDHTPQHRLSATPTAYDVVVIGGATAGLSGALALVRFKRRVLVIDSDTPRNAPAAHLHNYLGFDGRPPANLVAAGRDEVQSYGGELTTGEVVDVTVKGSDHHRIFTVALADGRTVTARSVLVATGVADTLPDVPGLAERWGRDVLHCPFCHGWEVRDQRVGILAGSPMVAHQALMFRQLSDTVTVFLPESIKVSDGELQQFAALGIDVIRQPLTEVLVSDDRLSGVRLADGSATELDALVVTTYSRARIDALSSLGLTQTPVDAGGTPIGTVLTVDALGATSVPGVYAAGNVVDLRGQLISSAAAGLNAAAMLNYELINADAQAAVQLSEMLEVPAWEERYGQPEQVWSGKPNTQLVAEVSGLTPGRVLDVGCGEGGDSIWLARQGWQVTAADFSANGLARGRAHAVEALGADAVTIDWRQTDLRKDALEVGAFDLVSAQFMQQPTAERIALFAKLAAAVAPGGTLLIVGHHPADLALGIRPHGSGDMLYTPEDVVADLDPTEWDILVAEARERPGLGHEGHSHQGHRHHVHDTVVRAVRRG